MVKAENSGGYLPIVWANFMGKPPENPCHFQQENMEMGAPGLGLLDKTDLTCGEMLHVFVIFCDQWKHKQNRDNGHTFLWKGRFVGFVALKKNQPQVSSQHLRSLAVPRGR